MKLLTYISIIIWALVPIRHYKSKYFFYFLFLASSDIITIIVRLVFHSNTNLLYAPFSFIALCALLDARQISKYVILLAGLFIITCIFNLDINITGIPEFKRMGLSLSIIHILILYIFIKELLITSESKHSINLFLVVLMFYEVMTVAKFINLLTGFANDYYYYKITGVFEILIGIFFIIFKADNKRLIFQFK